MIRTATETSPPADANPSPIDALGSFGGSLLTIGIIVAVSALLHLFGSRLIKRAVIRWVNSSRSRVDSMTDTPEATVELQSLIMSQRREQRAEAVGQLVRSAMIIALWGTASLLIMTQLGVNIAPIMASAGVVGVALGFGAQTLVKDYLSGFFMIVEDQYGVGDLVDVGEVTGTVEEVALRVTRIRDPSGVVWYVRNGEILRVANQSQGWTMAAVVIPVSYDADLEAIRTIVIHVGEDMAKDPETRQRMLGRPVFSGVDAVSGEAVYVRVMTRARAGQQIPLTRELRERLKMAFDRAGIVVPVLIRPAQMGPDGIPLPPGSAPPGAAAGPAG
ncbi:MAG: mechanosensitive ion channel family protein [Candidatus Nanopelagicales bacterium]